MEQKKKVSFIGLLLKSQTVLAGTATCLAGMVMITMGKISEGFAAVISGIGIIEGRKATERLRVEKEAKEGSEANGN